MAMIMVMMVMLITTINHITSYYYNIPTPLALVLVVGAEKW